MVDAVLVRIANLVAERLRPDATTPSGESENIDAGKFAARLGVSVRKVRDLKKKLREGEHYSRYGRRVLFHWPEARDFLRESGATAAPLDEERLVIDEVTQRRARAALKKRSA